MHRLIPARLRGRTRRALLATALALCALPAGAQAATVGIGNDGTLRYSAPDGETNSLSIRAFADSIHVIDTRGVRPTRLLGSFAQLCASIDSNTVRCPRSPVAITRIAASLGDRNDTAGPINTQLPVEIKGGEGNDTYEAGSPSFLTNVEFVGGEDADTANYAGSRGSGGGQGVRINNDGLPNDGRIGLDTDNIGRDVERLTGSAFADEITGNEARDCCTTTVTGGHGGDVLRAGSDSSGVRFVLFDMGPVADGADKIIGGPIRSTVQYSGRTRPVTATLNIGGADDGELGEGDEILGGHEFVAGGQAGDILAAPFGSTAPHVIDGNGGDDHIEGAGGPDRLRGGSGVDFIRGVGGNDQLFAKDGVRDTVDCGDETDTVEADSIDSLRTCENGTVGVLRLAPKTLRARANQTARLNLSWRHPVAWHKLRKVELRLTRAAAPVGKLTIRPRKQRMTADGAVRLVRKHTRLTRQGKTVTARLAVRLDDSLAGHTLKAEVEATDTRGARQLERDAGTVRVAH